MYSLAEEVSVSTVAATDTATGHHMLKIEGYSRLKNMHGNGSAFVSAEFEAAGHTWAIHCYPNGQRAEDAGFFSVFLRLADDADTKTVVLSAEYEFELVPHHGISLWPSPPPYALSSVVAFRKGNGWGFPKFVSSQGLEGSRFLKDDCLAVRCKITVVEESVVKEEVVQAQDLERMGMLCTDDTCNTPYSVATSISEALARFCRSLCGV